MVLLSGNMEEVLWDWGRSGFASRVAHVFRDFARALPPRGIILVGVFVVEIRE